MDVLTRGYLISTSTLIKGEILAISIISVRVI